MYMHTYQSCPVFPQYSTVPDNLEYPGNSRTLFQTPGMS